MQGWRGVRWLAGVVAMVCALAAGGPAWAANCNASDITTFSATSANAGNYNPFLSQVTKTVTVSVTATKACDLAISFQRATSPAMGPLSYTIGAVGGGGNYVYSSGLPTALNWVAISFTSATGGSTTRDIQITLGGGSIVADGTYSDTTISMELFDLQGATKRIKTGAFVPQATVIKVCKLDPPSLTSLNFNSAITNGRASPGVTKATSFTNVQCTAPTIVRLSGAALQPVPAIAARPNFDNFIGWRAIGTFGGATSTLNATTSTVTTADSATKNAASGATTSGTIGVTVNLLDSGKPILAGTYSGVLTVTIDPIL